MSLGINAEITKYQQKLAFCCQTTLPKVFFKSKYVKISTFITIPNFFQKEKDLLHR
jgi:hypothetical protein